MNDTTETIKKLKVAFENCYGINRLEYDFDFSEKNSYAIYAPNGAMKTSFAKTFEDFSKDLESCDLIFKAKETKRLIQNQSDENIEPHSIFVIKPYDEGYKSDKISTLLVNQKLKTEYEKIYNEINEAKEQILKELETKTGLKQNIEETLAKDIVFDKDDFFGALISLKDKVAKEEETGFSEVPYNLIFNETVQKSIGSVDFHTKLARYMEIYDELIDSSKFFKKATFDHNNAADIAKNLKSNKWFKAAHAVTINSDGERQEICTDEELEEFIQTEIGKILENQELKKSFDEVDATLKKNKELRGFRDFIRKNKFVLSKLDNMGKLKRRLWISYLSDLQDLYDSLMNKYESSEKRIQSITQKAEEEAPLWENVINIFNDRFSVPFKVRINNQPDVILSNEIPSLEFKFEDNSTEQVVEVMRNELLDVLSNGERRALYILNVIFEIEGRKTSKQPTIFIIDDIADSFDYKNKYAIIEYLKEISDNEHNLFKQIILSHNFDFFRTISGRLGLKNKMRLHVNKTKSLIKLKEEKYWKHPLEHWKDNMHLDEKQLIASIPFARNIAEYYGHDVHKSTLTSLLHIKKDTQNILINSLEKIMKEIFRNVKSFECCSPQNEVLKIIFKTADSICDASNDFFELEDKIVLSIAIRLKLELFLITKINDDNFVNNIKSNQTIKLINKYKEIINYKEIKKDKAKYSNENSIVKCAEQVNLMTPENIHLNSFMYEPILDMDGHHLKNLYGKISAL